MEVIGWLFLILFFIVVFGILGKLFGVIYSILGWLIDGVFQSIGCMFWIIVIILVIIALCS